jgi:transposase
MNNKEEFNPTVLKRMVEGGMSQAAIARHFGLSIPTVRKYLRLCGIKERQPGGRRPLLQLEVER